MKVMVIIRVERLSKCHIGLSQSFGRSSGVCCDHKV